MWSDKLGWLAFLIPILLWTWMTGVAAGWHNSPELITATFTLSTSVSNGHPLYLMLAHFFASVPLGDLPFRVSLFSAVAFSWAIWLTYRSGLHLLSLFPHLSPSSLFCRLFVLLPILAVSFAYTNCSQVTTVSIFTFRAALLMAFFERIFAALTVSDGKNSPSIFLTAIFWLTLASSDQPLIMLLFLLLSFSAILFKRSLRHHLPHYKNIFFVLLIGLSLFLYLPIRQHTSYSLTSLLEQIIFHPLAQEKFFINSHPVSFQDQVGFVVQLFFHQFGIFFSSIALLGFFQIFLRSYSFGFFIIFWFLSLLYPLFFYRLDFSSLQGFFIPILLMFSWGILAFFATLLEFFNEKFRRQHIFSHRSLLFNVAYWAILASLLLFLMFNLWRPLPPFAYAGQLSSREKLLHYCNRTNKKSSILWSEWLDEFLPRHALILTHYPQIGFERLYRQIIERHRLDLIFLPRNLLKNGNFARKILQKYPQYRQLISSYNSDKRLFVEELKKIAHHQFVFLEWADDLPHEIARSLYPVGFLFQYYPDLPTKLTMVGRSVDDRQILQQQKFFWQEIYQNLGSSLEKEPSLRAILLWTHYTHAHIYLYSGRWQAGFEELKRALKIAPNKPQLLRLAKQFRKKLKKSDWGPDNKMEEIPVPLPADDEFFQFGDGGIDGSQ